MKRLFIIVFFLAVSMTATWAQGKIKLDVSSKNIVSFVDENKPVGYGSEFKKVGKNDTVRIDNDELVKFSQGTDSISFTNIYHKSNPMVKVFELIDITKGDTLIKESSTNFALLKSPLFIGHTYKVVKDGTTYMVIVFGTPVESKSVSYDLTFNAGTDSLVVDNKSLPIENGEILWNVPSDTLLYISNWPNALELSLKGFPLDPQRQERLCIGDTVTIKQGQNVWSLIVTGEKPDGNGGNDWIVWLIVAVIVLLVALFVLVFLYLRSIKNDKKTQLSLDEKNQEIEEGHNLLQSLLKKIKKNDNERENPKEEQPYKENEPVISLTKIIEKLTDAIDSVEHKHNIQIEALNMEKENAKTNANNLQSQLNEVNDKVSQLQEKETELNEIKEMFSGDRRKDLKKEINELQEYKRKGGTWQTVNEMLDQRKLGLGKLQDDERLKAVLDDLQDFEKQLNKETNYKILCAYIREKLKSIIPLSTSKGWLMALQEWKDKMEEAASGSKLTEEQKVTIVDEAIEEARIFTAEESSVVKAVAETLRDLISDEADKEVLSSKDTTLQTIADLLARPHTFEAAEAKAQAEIKAAEEKANAKAEQDINDANAKAEAAKTELETKTRELNEKIKKAQEEAAEKEAARKAIEGMLNGERENHKAKLKEIKDNHKEELRKKEEEYTEALGKKDKEHKEILEKKDKEYKADLDAKEKAHTDAAELKELEHQEAIENLKNQLNGQIAAEKQAHEADNTKWQNTHDGDVQTIKGYHSDALGKIQRTLANVDNQLKEAYNNYDRSTPLGEMIDSLIRNNDFYPLDEFMERVAAIGADPTQTAQQLNDELKALYAECLKMDTPTWIDTLTRLYCYTNHAPIAEQFEKAGLDCQTIRSAFFSMESSLRDIGITISYPRLFHEKFDKTKYDSKPERSIDNYVAGLKDLIPDDDTIIDLYTVGYAIDSEQPKKPIVSTN